MDPRRLEEHEPAESPRTGMHAHSFVKITAAIADAVSREEVFEALVDRVGEAVGASSIGLWLRDETGRVARLVRGHGYSEAARAGIATLDLDGSLKTPALDAIRSGAAVWLRSQAELIERYPHLHAIVSAGRAYRVACLPLAAGGSVLGVLAITMEGPDEGAPEEQSFLLVVAQYASQAVERLRAFEAEHRARAEADAAAARLRVLSRASQVFAASDLALEASLRAVAAELAAALDSCVNIGLLKADGLLHLTAVQHPDPDAQLFLSALAGQSPLVPGEGLTGKIAADGQSVLVPSLDPETIASNAPPAYRGFLARYPAYALMGAALRVRGRVIGTVTATRTRPDQSFTSADLGLLEELAERAAIAIENSRLYEQAQSERDRLRELLAEQVVARRRLEEQAAQLAQARADAERAREAAELANRAKDEFLAILGHEMRNPLAPIMTCLQLLRMRGAQFRELPVIERQVQHLVRLIDDLLDISRITRGKLELKKDHFELARAVAGGLEIASPLLERRGQHLNLDVPPEGLPVIGDADRLAQVVANLLTNASKYSEPGATIHVRAEAADGMAVLRVRDEGIGIAPEMLTKVFELFVQEPQALDRSRGGLGLGLTVVRNLVELHGGRVEAHSEGLGRGSEFTVELPLATAAEHVVEAQIPAIVLPARGRGRVLVVDDNVDAADALELTLTRLGYDVAVAHDGPSALQVAERFMPDVCLLDVGLPAMDGYELARRLRELPRLPPAARLIAVTGYGQDSDRERSAAAGFCAHLVKPVSVETLTRTLA